MVKSIVGIDIGGTNTVIGIFDDSKSLLMKEVIPTLKLKPDETNDNPQHFLDVLAESVFKLIQQTGESKPALVGIGVPGIVDAVKGMVVDASNLKWKRVSLAKEMSRRLQAPVYIDNDVRMYALGEAMNGAGKGYNHIICLTLGTGLAAGIVMNGQALSGSRMHAGEIGHDQVEGASYPCACGKKGCLETIASASGIARLAEEAVRSNRKTTLRTLKTPITSYDVYQAYVNGDKTAEEILQYVGTVLGKKLATVVNMLDPDMIIIGGGAAAAGDVILDPIRREITTGTLNQDQQQTIICTGKLKDTAGLIGSVHNALIKAGGQTYQDNIHT